MFWVKEEYGYVAWLFILLLVYFIKFIFLSLYLSC